jgi:hypothetical protein
MDTEAAQGLCGHFSSEKKAPKGRGRAPLEKFPEKKSDASVEKKQSKREDSDAFLVKRGEGAVRAEGFGCGFGKRSKELVKI